MKNEWIEDIKLRISDKSNVDLKIFYTQEGLEAIFKKDQDLFYQQAKLSKVKCNNSCHRIIELNDGSIIEYVRRESINIQGRRFRSIESYCV